MSNPGPRLAADAGTRAEVGSPRDAWWQGHVRLLARVGGGRTLSEAKAPVIRKEWVRPGTHLSCIGADAEGKEEIDPEIYRGAVIFVDDMVHCVEAGETEIPLKKGIISREDIAGEIGDLILQKVPGRTSDEQITIYDATGMALLDIAAGKAALDLAKKKNLGSDAVL